nr:hypothetical protein [uncultured bacterium]
MTSSRSPRTRLLVYPRFQLTLIAVNLGVMLAVVGATFIAVTRSYSVLKSEGMSIGLRADHPYFKFLELQSAMVYKSMGLAVAAGAVLSVLLLLVLSHWLTGPIVRLRTHFERIAEGQAAGELLNFRRRDFFPDLPEVVNRAVAQLREKR